jgi:polysaccharide export outer membrane protein
MMGNSMKAMLRCTAVLLLGLVQAAAVGQTNAPADKSADKPKDGSAGTVQQPKSVAGATYVIGADDTLHIDVWKEQNLTVTLPVRPDGMISLPLLNDVQAAGLTPMQLAASITEKLKKYVTDPRVTVVVTQMNSQRFYVTGEVLHTGAMPLLPNMTVLQALASAGFTQFANLKGIYLLRMENGRQNKIPINYKALVKGEAVNQNILLKPGDTIVVP